MKIYIYRAKICISLWSVHQFSGDYNPIHNHAAGETGLSFIFWTKVPDKMRNASAGNLYSVSGKDSMDVLHLLETILEASLISNLIIKKFMHQKLDIF